ncbi:3-dehydroquinate synthase [Polaribacter sargassicola]|uniref:3-dehydroquinate synthase n=1 Tax=Polaribacter sargassicola TaxID=2836891 RepID=UPI001EFF6431|nr:3-dehydroquinate synthase [Polaribacter sp. DS7-9]MCG1036740.1 3-dehydroquinate synthase [Polaribacter sp. DS7-9]
MKSIQAVTYPVHFQDKAYIYLSNLIEEKNYSTIFILVDENTFEHCYPKFIQNLTTDKTIEVIEIESGEINKNLETCVGVWNAITELGGDRKSLLITLGGGVITDLGGFVASCFKRGIDFVNIPTTLLSMVDASVGGKTGVDLGVLKNQIGLFANPQMVIVDTDYLKTVTEREIKSGTAEIIKYGVTYDINLFNEIKDNKDLNISDLIFRSIEIKNEVVLQDPKEQNLRKILNFGHTLGHAIESFYLESEDKENLTHGEAIAIGMVCECYMSAKLLGFPSEKVNELKEVVLSIYEKTNLLKDDFSAIIELLKHDKKNVNGQVNFVLLNDFEDYKIDCKVPEELIIESMEFYNI